MNTGEYAQSTGIGGCCLNIPAENRFRTGFCAMSDKTYICLRSNVSE